MCHVSYGRKRDKQIVLSSRMISWEYITEILVFWNNFFLTCFCLCLLFFRSFSYEHWRTNNENRAMNKPEKFWSSWAKLHHKHLKCSCKCMEITSCGTRDFERYKRFKDGREEVKDDSRSGRHTTSRTEINVDRVKLMVCGDGQLTVWMIASHLDMKKDNVWKIITRHSSVSEK